MKALGLADSKSLGAPLSIWYLLLSQCQKCTYVQRLHFSILIFEEQHRTCRIWTCMKAQLVTCAHSKRLPINTGKHCSRMQHFLKSYASTVIMLCWSLHAGQQTSWRCHDCKNMMSKQPIAWLLIVMESKERKKEAGSRSAQPHGLAQIESFSERQVFRAQMISINDFQKLCRAALLSLASSCFSLNRSWL